MRWLALLVLLGGCDLVFGLSHEVVPEDAPPPDEDGDGVADGVDNCPGTANADQADRDGDQVGDVCDPHPDVPGDEIVATAFFGGNAADGGWIASSGWTVAGGLATNGSDAQLMRSALGTTPTIELGFTVLALGTPAAATVRLTIGDGTSTVFCHVDPEPDGGFGVFLVGAATAASTTDRTQRLVLQTDVTGARCTDGQPISSPNTLAGALTDATIAVENQEQIAISYIVVYATQ